MKIKSTVINNFIQIHTTSSDKMIIRSSFQSLSLKTCGIHTSIIQKPSFLRLNRQKLHFEPWVVFIVGATSGQDDMDPYPSLEMEMLLPWPWLLLTQSSKPPQSDGSLHQQVHVQLVLNHGRSHCQLRND